MIKYIGSKRRLVPLLSDLFARSGASTAIDMFSGTTRVARAFKEHGADVTAVDITRYGEVLARYGSRQAPRSLYEPVETALSDPIGD